MNESCDIAGFLSAVLVATLIAAAGCTPDNRSCQDESDCFKGEVCRNSEHVAGKICVEVDSDATSADGTSDGDGSTRDFGTIDSATDGDSSTEDTGGANGADANDADTALPDGCEMEACNGTDDDCDGKTDEPRSCPKTKGVCANKSAACAENSYESCTDAYGSDYEMNESTVDGKDNDCDGTTDELFKSIDMETEELTCGRLQNDDLYCWGTQTTRSAFTGVTFPISGSFQQLAVGTDALCARGSNDKLRCWGNDNGVSLTSPPSGTYNQVDVGATSACALASSDNKPDCWGATSGTREDQAFDRISVESSYCGVTTNQTLDCWGNSLSGALDNTPVGTFKEVDVYGSRACAIAASSGTVECWGRSPAPDPSSSAGYAAIDVVETIKQSNGDVATYACGILSSSGKINCWGYTQTSGAPPSNGGFTDVAVEPNGGCAVARDGHVECWGKTSTPN